MQHCKSYQLQEKYNRDGPSIVHYVDPIALHKLSFICFASVCRTTYKSNSPQRNISFNEFTLLSASYVYSHVSLLLYPRLFLVLIGSVAIQAQEGPLTCALFM